MNKKFERTRIVVDVEKSLHKKLKIMAAEEGKSLRDILLEAIERVLNERDSAN